MKMSSHSIVVGDGKAEVCQDFDDLTQTWLSFWHNLDAKAHCGGISRLTD